MISLREKLQRLVDIDDFKLEITSDIVGNLCWIVYEAADRKIYLRGITEASETAKQVQIGEVGKMSFLNLDLLLTTFYRRNLEKRRNAFAKLKASQKWPKNTLVLEHLNFSFRHPNQVRSLSIRGDFLFDLQDKFSSLIEQHLFAGPLFSESLSSTFSKLCESAKSDKASLAKTAFSDDERRYEYLQLCHTMGIDLIELSKILEFSKTIVKPHRL